MWAAGRIKGIPISEALHVVERFTRVDADTIQYEAVSKIPTCIRNRGRLHSQSPGAERRNIRICVP